MLAEAGQDGNDPPWALSQDVLEEDGLKLERVLALVIELIGIRVESVSARGQGVDALHVGLHVSERCGEGLAAQCEGSPHGSMRCAEEDEGVGLGRESGGKGAVCMPVAQRSAPRVDVRRDEPDHRLSVGGTGRSRLPVVCRGQARLLDVPPQLGCYPVIGAAGVCGVAHGGLRKLALHRRARLAEHGALQEKTALELVGQTHHDLRRDLRAELPWTPRARSPRRSDAR